MEALAHPRQRRKEARPAELTAAALELFVEKGFAGTRLEDVAARAGVSKARSTCTSTARKPCSRP
jgi:AcrR family transcriptional regulator